MTSLIYVVKTGFIVHLKLAFVNIVVICNVLFMSVFYFDSLASYCVCFFIFLYIFCTCCE